MAIPAADFLCLFFKLTMDYHADIGIDTGVVIIDRKFLK